MDSKTLYEVVTTLTGPIKPIGETYIDGERLENLRSLTELIGSLVKDIIPITRTDNQEYSIKKARILAGGFVEYLKELLEDETER